MESNRLVNDIFDTKPSQWGLRGDHFLWEEMRRFVLTLQLPNTADEFRELLIQIFTEFTGEPPQKGKDFFVEEFDKGGMSSGYVSSDFWVEKGFPLLSQGFKDCILKNGQTNSIRKRVGNNLVGVTGEYYVSAELGKRGVLALLTPKNNPLFDIVAITPDASKTISIQVKTMSERNNQGWKLGKEICRKRYNPNLYVVLVNLTSTHPEFYIYEYDTLSERVAEIYEKYLKTPKKDGSSRKDIDFRWFDFKYFTEEDNRRKDSWDLLGF
jgi:hypothetical protein